MSVDVAVWSLCMCMCDAALDRGYLPQACIPMPYHTRSALHQHECIAAGCKCTHEQNHANFNSAVCNLCEMHIIALLPRHTVH